MKVLVGIYLVLSIFIISNINSYTEGILNRLSFYTRLFIDRAPPYVWGGNFGLLGGDCSGQMQALYSLSGLRLPRLNSLGMWNGGWPGRRYTVTQGAREGSDFPNLIFFDYSPLRPRGHVGIVRWNKINNKSRRLMFAEASSSKKYFKETLIKQGDFRWNHIYGILVVNLTPGF